MALNVVRAAPAFFTDKIREVRKTHPLAKTANHTNELIKHMQTMSPLDAIEFNRMANVACKQNNEDKADKFPSAGGNKAKFLALCEEEIPCEEYTMANYPQNTGAEFVALALILNWSRPSKQSPILSTEVKSVGINVMPHKQTINLI